MKKKIHPHYCPTCFIDISSKKKFLTFSTLKSKKILSIKNIKYYVVTCEVTSSSHPVYTGEKRFVDTEGRVEKFRSRYKKING
jgi:large subunit ribosomal protein L31